MQESEKNYSNREASEIALHILLGILFFGILPITAGLIFFGFEEAFATGEINIANYLGSYIVYIPFAIVALSLILFPIMRMKVIPRGVHPAMQEDPKWYTIFTVSLINSPEENGLLYRVFNAIGLKKNPMRWSSSMLRVTSLSIVLFGAFGFVVLFAPQYAISDVPKTTQQITTFSDIVFGSLVPGFTENGFILFLYFLELGCVAYMTSKFMKNKKAGLFIFFIVAFLLIFFQGWLWSGLHGVVYKNSDVKAFATLIFGTIGHMLTLLLGIEIPYLVWHVFNNLAIKLGELAQSNEDINVYYGIYYFSFCALYLLGEYIALRIRRWKRKKNQLETIVIPD